VLRADVELDCNDLREPNKTLKLQSRTPSLLQDRTSLPAFLVELRNSAEFSFRPIVLKEVGSWRPAQNSEIP
jgi:hypothetical protein